MKLPISALLIASLAALAPLASADVAADYTGGGFSGNYPNATGFWFSVNQNITVTGVGFYDLSGTGLQSSHDVGIFKADGTAVVSGVVDSGTTDSLISGTVGGTRVKAVTATTLVTGQDYYCVADNLSLDQYTFGTGAVTFNSVLNWESYGDMSSNNIFSGTPTKPGGISGNLDGTFTFQAVPEPSSLLILPIGVVGLLALRRRS